MKSLNMAPELYAYLLQHCPIPTPTQQKVIKATQARSDAQMQMCQDQAAFMGMLVKLLGAKSIVEVGTFTGYSSLAMALQLPEGGKVVTLDINPETSAFAKSMYAEAGVGDKVDARVGRAQDILLDLIKERGPNSFDMAFIDADKESVQTYYELCLKLIRPNGLIMVDNVLWSGRVIQPQVNDSSTAAIRAFNEDMPQDNRVDSTMLPCADGIYMLRKK